MNSSKHKKHTVQAKRGIKGEAFFESLISDYALPHHIVGSKDIGIDYFCEWVYGEEPTGILFAAQVKTFSEKTIKLKYVKVNKGLNGLDEYEIRNPHLRVKEETLHYWKGLGIPVYLFVVVQSSTDNGEERLDCYYKRFAPILTWEVKREQIEFHRLFYKVSKGNLFIAFKNPETQTQGFARDLFIDHVRWCYSKGSITYLDPRIIGLNQFRPDSVLVDLFTKYKEQISSAYKKTGEYLEQVK